MGQPAPAPPRHLPQLDSLRGLAALWVYLAHVQIVCGVGLPWLPSPINAVLVFVLLSGFVIAKLRFENPEPYRFYIARRAIRLYPAYLVALPLGILAGPYFPEVYGSPMHDDRPFPDLLRLHGNETQYFWAHLAAHLTLLHGLPPDEVLPQGTVALLGPAWSISLEWQFYLVAPALAWALAAPERRPVRSAAVLLAAAVGPRVGEMVGSFEQPAFLPLLLPFFMIGMLSAKLHPLLAARTEGIKAAVVGLAAMGILIFGARAGLPILIWLVVFYATLEPETRAGRILSAVLSWRVLRGLGAMSYSFYLLHTPILIAAAVPLLRAGVTDKWTMYAAMLAITLPLTLAASAIVWQFVERPAIAFGKAKLAARKAETLVAIRQSKPALDRVPAEV